jgi:hypothetical protein
MYALRDMIHDSIRFLEMILIFAADMYGCGYLYEKLMDTLDYVSYSRFTYVRYGSTIKLNVFMKIQYMDGSAMAAHPFLLLFIARYCEHCSVV